MNFPLDTATGGVSFDEQRQARSNEKRVSAASGMARAELLLIYNHVYDPGD